jgi:hydroxymethylpyrimidine pyrophosphatase-like HAD family hydrolase
MILFSDLDRTIVHPISLLQPGAAQWESVEIFEERDLTCMSTQALSLLAEFSQRHAFVPVTTRSAAQVARIVRVVAAAHQDTLICCNGARILRDGIDDPTWHAVIDNDRKEAASITEVQAALDALFGEAHPEGWLERWRDCESMFLYGICDLDRTPEGVESAAQTALEPLGWRVWFHGRKLYALPQCITKERATEYLREQLGYRHEQTVGAGDSEMDRGLVEWAAQGWVPARSELAHGGGFSDSVRLGEQGHIAFTEEILRTLLQEAAARA